MSVRHVTIDRSACELAIYCGTGSEALPANLHAHAVDFSIREGVSMQVRIPYVRQLSDDRLDSFKAAVVLIVQILTKARQITTSEKRDFASNLALVQSCQARSAGRGAA